MTRRGPRHPRTRIERPAPRTKPTPAIVAGDVVAIRRITPDADWWAARQAKARTA